MLRALPYAQPAHAASSATHTRCAAVHVTVLCMLQESPRADLGASGRLSSLVGPSIAFMGDSSHAVQPAIGQVLLRIDLV